MPGIRGCLSAMLKVLGHVGVLLSYIAGTYLNWRQSALLVAIAPSMLFLGTLFIPETPSYLVLNGKDDEAANSLQWLRGDHVDIRHELQVIHKAIVQEYSSLNIALSSDHPLLHPQMCLLSIPRHAQCETYHIVIIKTVIHSIAFVPFLHGRFILKLKAPFDRRDCVFQVIKTNILASRAKQYELTFKNSMFTPRLYKPIAITCGLMFFQRFSGANAFNYYAVIIFRQTLGGMNPHGATIAIGFVQLLASLLSGTVTRDFHCVLSRRGLSTNALVPRKRSMGRSTSNGT